jgi:hypothetical protein
MKRYSPLLLLTVLLVLFAAPTISQAAPSASPALANSPTIPHLALRDSAAEEEDEEVEAGEEIEFDECEASGGDFEFEDEEFEEVEEEEEFEIEIEECEEEVKSKAGAVTAPKACRVRTAESSITTLPASDRVLLTVRYETYAPSTISLGLKLKDHKGSLKIERATKHLGNKGVLHLSSKLSDAEMERAAKAQEFNVALRALNTPGYCGGLLEQQLRSKHPVGNARVYTQTLDG